MACANAQHVVGRGSGLGMSAYMVAMYMVAKLVLQRSRHKEPHFPVRNWDLDF